MALTAITKDFITRAGVIVQGTAAVSSSTGNLGALQVNAGAGIAKNLIVGSTATIYGATTVYNSLNVTGVGTFENSANAGAGTGALVVSNGGAYINQDLLIDGTTAGSSSGGALNVASGGAYISGVTYIADTTTATNASTAALSVQGGMYAAENLLIDGSGNSTDGTPAFKLTNGGALIDLDAKIDGTTAAGTGTGALVVSAGGAYVNQELWVDSSTNGTSAGGALNVKSGGVYVNQDIYVDGTTAASTTSAALYVATGGGYIGGDLIVNGTTAGGIGAGALKVTGGGNFGGDVYVDSSTTANVAGGGTAALRLAGGAYIGDNLIVNSLAFDTGTNTSNALYVKGGAWIDKTLVVGGQVTFQDSVFFNGTATYVLSTNTVYTDNLLQLHMPPGGDVSNHVWTGDDGKDIGFIFHYFKGADQDAFLGFANDSGYLEWYDQGSENTSGVYVGTRYGTFKTGNIELVGNTSATSTATGTLIVDGGVGISGDVYVGGTLNVNKLESATDIDATVTTATNLKGGSLGEIPIQYGNGQTAFIAAGTATNQVLVWSTVSSTATWVSPGTQVVGAAANVVGGAAGQIPFQSAPSTTIFDSEFNYDNATNTLNVFNLNATGTIKLAAYDINSVTFINNDGDLDTVGATTFGFNSGTTVLTVGAFDIDGINGTITADTGVNAEIISDTLVKLNYSATNYLYVDSDGVSVEAPDLRVGMNETDALITLHGSTTNRITMPQGAGAGAPTNTNYSAGTKLVLWDNVGASSTGYAMGIENNAMWFGLDILANTHSFKWYGNTTAIMTLTNELLETTGALKVHNDAPTFTAATSGAVRVQGGVGIAKDLYVASTATFDGIVSLTNTASDYTTSSNNALYVAGGVGIAQDLYVASTATIDADLYVGGTIYMKGVGLDQITSSTGTFDYVFIEGTGTGLTVYDDAWIKGSTVSFGATGANQIENLSTTTMEVRGGWGNDSGTLSLFAGNYPTTYSKIQLNGNKTITTEANTFTFKDFNSVNLVTVNASTASSNITSGAVVVSGGVGIQENLNVGGYGRFDGPYDETASTSTIGVYVGVAGAAPATPRIGFANSGTTWQIDNSNGDFRIFTPFASHVKIESDGDMTLYSTSNSTSTLTGALIVSGGVGVAKDVVIGGNLDVAGVVTFTNTTQAEGTGTDTGAVKITGGLLVKKNIVAGGLVIGGDYMGGAVPTNPANQTVEAFKGSNNMQAGFTTGVISGSSETNLDVFNATLYTTAKYIVQVKDGSNVHSAEILLIHNGTNAYLTEYAIITSNGELGTFGADLSGGNVTLKFVPTSATAMRINVIRTSILTSISAYAV